MICHGQHRFETRIAKRNKEAAGSDECVVYSIDEDSCSRPQQRRQKKRKNIRRRATYLMRRRSRKHREARGPPLSPPLPGDKHTRLHHAPNAQDTPAAPPPTLGQTHTIPGEREKEGKKERERERERELRQATPSESLPPPFFLFSKNHLFVLIHLRLQLRVFKDSPDLLRTAPPARRA